MRRGSILSLFSVVSLTAASLYSQEFQLISPTRGFQPAHSYSISDIESIDNATGALSLHIPITQLPPGPAGFSAGVTLVYSSKYWETQPTISQNGAEEYVLKTALGGGWHLATMVPTVQDIDLGISELCSVWGESVFQLRVYDSDGSSHALHPKNLWQYAAPGAYCLNGGDFTNPTVWYSADTSFSQVVMGPYLVNGWTLTRNDGSSVQFDPMASPPTTYLRDRNGNTITYTSGEVGPGITYQQLEDESGRTIRIEHHLDYLTGYDQITQTAHDQTTLTWTVQYRPFPSLSGNANKYLFKLSGGTDWCCNKSFSSVTPKPILVSNLQLPNGLHYDFSYNARYGEMSQMVLPTGATVNYAWRLNGATAVIPSTTILSNTISSKTVQHDGGASETWQYAYTVNELYSQSSTSSMTAPDGGLTQYEFSQLSYLDGGGYPGGLVQKVTQPDGSILRREWDFNHPYGLDPSLFANAWIRTECETRAGSGATSVRAFTVDKNGHSTSREERDWVSDSGPCPPGSTGALRRKTMMTYVNGAQDSTYTGEDLNAYSHTTATSPRNLVASNELLNGAGTKISRSEFVYNETNGNLLVQCDWDDQKGTSIGTCAVGQPSNAMKREYTYTGRGNLASEKDPRGNTTTYSYGVIPNCPISVSGDLYRTSMQRGGITSMQQNWAYTHNCYSGLRTSVTDPNGLVATTTYDNYGRPTVVTEGPLRATHYTYDDTSRWIVVQNDVATADDKRNVTAFRFDQLGRIRLMQQFENAPSAATAGSDEAGGIKAQTIYKFDSGRNAVLVSNPYRGLSEPTNGWTVTRRDTVGRVCAEETFSGAAEPSVATGCAAASAGSTGMTTYSYNATATDTIQTITDPAGAVRELRSDVLGRLISVVEHPNTEPPYTTTYGYNERDNLLSVTQAGANARTFTYSSLNRLLTANNPESGTTSYSYDDAGNLLTRTMGGVTRTSTYDDLNRVKTQSYSGGVLPTPQVDYAYDTADTANRPASCIGDDGPIGQLASVSNFVSANYYYYNKLGHAVCSRQKTGTDAFDFQYTPTPQGQWAATIFPSGKTVSTTFDDAGRATSVAAAASYASGIQYEPHGAIKQLTLGNGVTETTGHNGRLQPTSIAAANGGGSLLNLGYGYTKTGGCNGTATCNNGNVMQQTIAVGGWSVTEDYTYDGANRLLTAAEGPTNPWTEQFGYDSRGNQWVSGATGITLSPLTPLGGNWFDANNRLERPGFPDDFQYDGAGNQSTMGDPTVQLVYDGENRLMLYQVGSSLRELYDYDGEGRRVQHQHQVYQFPSWTTTASTQYVYDARGRLAAEYGAATSNPNCTTCYLTQDHLGSTRLMTDQAGAPVARYDYLPFGQEILPPPSGGRADVPGYGQGGAVTQKFTRKERDAETGLDYFIARYNSSAQGRFTSPDPENASGFFYSDDPQSWNGYAYGRNNPLTFTDPTGTVYCYGDPGSDEEHCVDDQTYKNDPKLYEGYTHYEDEKNPLTITPQAEPDLSPGAIAVLSDLGSRPMLEFSAAVFGAGAVVGATGGAACYYLCSSASLTTLGTSIGLGSIPAASNPQLQTIINKLYQITDKLPGGTAGAVRYESRTGDLLSKAGHSQKAQQIIRELTDALKSGKLSVRDQVTARQLIQELKDALATKPR